MGRREGKSIAVGAFCAIMLINVPAFTVDVVSTKQETAHKMVETVKGFVQRLLPPELRERLEKQIPVQRFGRISDVADAALFLCSDAASFINGSVMVVDGGAWMTMAGFGMTP